MAPPILHLRDIHLTFGGTALLEGAELSVAPGERLCLVGRNGSGKSTLLKIAAGLIEAQSGERFVQPGIAIRYLPQVPDLAGFATTLVYVEAGLGPQDDPYRARYLLEQLGLTGEEDPAVLSGGETRRAALARVLAPEPTVLLLDEPTNHLDLPAIEWLEGELKSLRSALVLISHDRRFLENLSSATVWLDRGRTRRLDAGFAKFEDWRDRVFAEEERDRERLDKKLAQETEWLRRGVTARRRRNQGRLRALFDLRDERKNLRKAVGTAELVAAEGDLGGKLVLEAKGIGKTYGDRAVVKDFSLRVQRGDRIGIIGPNGAGKTTLLDMLTGNLAPDTGRIRLGKNLQIQSLDQHREHLAPTTTLSEALTGGHGDTVNVGGESRHVIGYLKDFLFTPEQVRTPISALSGGERGRLMLARALARPSNLLVLDEPTNDLDLETLDLLQEMLADYDGTVLLVSHDRDFLDRVCASTVVSEGNGRWQEYAGGYTDMLTQRGAAPAARQAPKIARAARAEPRAGQAKPVTRTKLSFKDKHALETLPAKIEALRGEIARHQAKLDDPGLFGRDPKAFDGAVKGLEQAQAALAAAEEEWLALEIKREELEG
jgi:ATP-binding cassette subfamily F protein uup